MMQVELHAISWMDQGRSPPAEALPDEIWCGAMDANSGDATLAWQAHPAAEWSDTALDWSAILSR